LVKQHAGIVAAISERDRLLDTAHTEHRLVQEELSKLAGSSCSSEAAFQLEAFGLGQAPPQIRDPVSTLLLQIKQLAALATAGNAGQPCEGQEATLVLPPSLLVATPVVGEVASQGQAAFKPVG